ncbi:hypothetical protein [Saccharopolyspora spinosa]|uniref:hypothetical protein n=1 Tax=Saccharopolyspora spinosa TaxID=60894 RepID=UPI0037496D48
MWDRVLAVTSGPFRLAALIGTRIAEGDGGSIVNVSSVAAIWPAPIELPYAVRTSRAVPVTGRASTGQLWQPKRRTAGERHSRRRRVTRDRRR